MVPKNFSAIIPAIYKPMPTEGGYDGVYLKSSGSIKEVACWAHGRRYWHKAREEDPARAHHVLAIVAKLYNVEHAAREKSAEEIHGD